MGTSKAIARDKFEETPVLCPGRGQGERNPWPDQAEQARIGKQMRGISCGLLRVCGGRHGSWNLSALDLNQLWYQRNRDFKDAGYCFRTSRAIRMYGNAGPMTVSLMCRYPIEPGS
jgi:YARHG domain